jgi:2-methylisocitrate lyase-like PEP mutase family enzyme
MSQQAAKLRQLLEESSPVIAPGVFDGLSARLVEQAGFSAVYASGGAIARSAGIPDIGLMSFTEVCNKLGEITEACSLPVIADADTGFGNALNVRRMIQLYERLGVAGCHIEDQQFPKRCGHLDNKKLVSTDEMVQKIRAAVRSRQDKNFLIIARTDAIAVEGFDAAIARAATYHAAGADMLFVEAPQTLEQIEAIGRQITAPKLINMFYGGKTPLVPVEQLKAFGYALVIIPSDLQRAAIKSMQLTLEAIRLDGDSHAMSDGLVSFNDREKIIDTQKYFDFDQSCFDEKK